MEKSPLINVLSMENELLNQHKDFVAVPTYSSEGVGDFISGLSNFFANKLKFISSFIANEKTTFPGSEISEYGKQLKFNSAKIENIIKNKPVTLVLDTDVIMPMGFKSDLITVSKLLDKSIRLIDNTLFLEIDKVDTKLSYLLTDEGYRLTSRPIVKNSSLIELNKTLNKYLKDMVGISTTDEVYKVRSILPSVNKLREVNETLLSISSSIHLDNLERIRKSSTTLREKCEELYVISKNNSDFKIKKDILIDLAMDLENIASLITTSSAIYTYYVQIINSFLLACETLNNV